MNETEIIVVGAGASGLMAAKVLSRAGKEVIVLEARERLGGRIYPLSLEEGTPSEGGAEFVHGNAPLTRLLIREAGLTYVDFVGEAWNVTGDIYLKTINGPTSDPVFLAHKELIGEKLKKLSEDISIADFLEKYFAGNEYRDIREWILGMVTMYDTADPKKISTLTLGGEWLSGGEWKQGKIKEGYGALVNFLAAECQKAGVEIRLGQEVEALEMKEGQVEVRCKNREVYTAQKVLVTIPPALLGQISFTPPLPEKTKAASKMELGGVIKILLKFEGSWWYDSTAADFSKTTFIISDRPIPVWWTQYPRLTPILTGWIGGPKAVELSSRPEEEIINLAITSLVGIFKVGAEVVRARMISSVVVNWPADPLARGAYSYPTLESKENYLKVIAPVDNKIFFAGEALYSGEETATVEGALGSGKEVAERMLERW